LYANPQKRIKAEFLREAKISLTDTKTVMANDHHQNNILSIEDWNKKLKDSTWTDSVVKPH
jgi:hypothetical protein